MKTILYGIKKVVAMLTGASGTVDGTGIDRMGYDEVTLLVTAGAATGTPDSFSVNCKLQESDDNSTFTDVADGAITALVAAGTGEVSVIGKPSLKRYIRTRTVHAFVNGTSPKVPVSVAVLLGRPESGPVA